MVRKSVGRLFRLSVNELRPRYVLLEGLAAGGNSVFSGSISILGHSRDYERVLASGLLDSKLEAQEYCVFLDSNEARHEDFEILGFARRDIVDEEWYREALQRSFKAIAEATGLRVIIVPHPRYKYPDGYFGPFHVCEEDSVQAVASSKLVVGHYSTSLGLAVIFNKPVILLNCGPMRKLAGGFADRSICGFQRAFGCISLDMDNLDRENFKEWQSINIEKFSKYWDQYVKYPAGPKGSMWENATRIIAQHEGWDS